MRVRKRNRAVALLLVILVVALMTVIVAAFAVSSNVDMLVARNGMDELKARTAIAGAVQYAAVLLKVDRMESEYDALDEPWAEELEFELGDVEIKARIVDEASKFSLNRFLNAQDEPRSGVLDLWEDAVFAAGLPSDTVDAMLALLEKRAETPAEEMEEEQDVQPASTSSEDDFVLGDAGYSEESTSATEYAPIKVPIQPRELELLLFGEITSSEEDAARRSFCEQFTTVSRGWVNLNTASEELLGLIFSSDEATIVDTIVAERENSPFQVEGDLSRVPSLGGTGKSRIFSVRSTIFTVNVEARIGRTVKRAVCVLKRFKSGQCIPIYYKDDIPVL